jgi:hypothetical protein
MCIFVIICLSSDRKEELHREKSPAAFATRARDSSSNHTDDYFKKTDHEGFSRRRLALCETLRAPSHVQGRRNAREAANPPRREKSKQAPADEGYRRLRRVFGRGRSKQPARQGGRLFDSFCRLHPADVTDRGANGRGQMTWFASEEKQSKRCQRDERPKGGRPADEQVPFTFSGTDALHDADEKEKGTHTSIIAGEAGQRHHVMYHYKMGALPARSGAAVGAVFVTGLRLPGVAQEKTVCGTRARSVAFHRVEGRVCDPRSRACAAARQERWAHRRTGTDRGDGWKGSGKQRLGLRFLNSSSGAPG